MTQCDVMLCYISADTGDTGSNALSLHVRSLKGRSFCVIPVETFFTSWQQIKNRSGLSIKTCTCIFCGSLRTPKKCFSPALRQKSPLQPHLFYSFLYPEDSEGFVHISFTWFISFKKIIYIFSVCFCFCSVLVYGLWSDKRRSSKSPV